MKRDYSSSSSVATPTTVSVSSEEAEARVSEVAKSEAHNLKLVAKSEKDGIARAGRDEKSSIQTLSAQQKSEIESATSTGVSEISQKSAEEKNSISALAQQEREKFLALVETSNNEIKNSAPATTPTEAPADLKVDVEKPKTAKAKHITKRTLAGNMNITYKVLPEDVDSFQEMFTKGLVYGRLRMNSFHWDWKDDDKYTDNYALGLGGSLVYKTGRLNGLSGTVGLYTSQNPFMTMDPENAGSLKAGKDTLSRYDVKAQGQYGLTVLGESYLQYDTGKTKVKFGRQMFHTVFTKSNDTKMIPNTFDGISVDSKSIPNSRLQLAYFQAQKLRDHTTSHDVITFKDENGESWANNDDSAIHKGLNFSNFQKAGESTHHNLLVGAYEWKPTKKFQFIASYLTVPDVISNLTVEAHYKTSVGEWSVTPGIRYMSQFDDGAGQVGGASLKGSLASWTEGADARGYKDPDSLDSSLLALRAVAKNKSGTTKLLYGYSAVEDKGDIVAPWRGFPTGGYTRAMAQYNWNANTKTHMVQGVYDFGKAGKIDGFKVSARYAIMDFDDNKQDVESDRTIVHIDLFKKFKALPDFEAKVRFATVDSKHTVTETTDKPDTSYNEYRLEFNYLF
jgi:hypothetical protein